LVETEKETIGVILLNLGGPDSLQAIRPFLYNLFSDRDIIRLGPPFLQKPIAWLISSLRSKKTEKMYELIGRKSPILDITYAQAKALKEALNTPPPTPPPRGGRAREGVTGIMFRVYEGMRYWHPFIEEIMPEIYGSGIRKLLAISLYPHYSRATTGSALSRFKEVVSRYPIKSSCISSWFNHPLYIEALIDVIKKGLDSFKMDPALLADSGNIQLLFSAHSLPESFIKEGDPYVHQIQGTIKEIIQKINIEWHLSYQSKSGPLKWLEPSTEEMLRKLAEGGYKNILVVPISFVSDHIETLFEIDILYRNMAEELGMVLKRVESLNTHPLFIEALKDMVVKNVKEMGWA
jgi:ferrochelatase